MTTVLAEVLRQTVKITQSDKSRTVTKGEALILVLMNQATKGNRRYTDAVLTLTEKIADCPTSPKMKSHDAESRWFQALQNREKSGSARGTK